jgi:hypothetical protein
VKRARVVLGLLAPAVRQADFFTEDLGGSYDLIYERTFLCSLPPVRWPDYILRMTKLLRPGGKLAGIFYYGSDPDGPPFPLSASTRDGLFAPFDLIVDREIPLDQSLPLFAGDERWQEWQLKTS